MPTIFDQLRTKKSCNFSPGTRLLRQARLLSLPLATLVLSSCIAPRIQTAVPGFTKAVDLTADNTRSAFQIVQQKYDEAEASKLAFNYGKDGFHPDQVHPWLEQTDVDARLTLVRALQTYAVRLDAVSGSKPTKGIDESTKGVADALTTATSSGRLQKIATKVGFDPNAAASAVDAFGRLLVERKRNRDLPGLVRDMQAPVQLVSELLARDLDTLRNQLSLEYKQLLMDQDAFITDNVARMSPTEKREQIERLPAMVREQAAADKTIGDTAASLRALPKANLELFNAVQNHQDAGTAIGSLFEQASEIGDFYDSLSSPKKTKDKE